MPNTNDFSVLLKAVLDSSAIGETDIAKVQKVLNKYRLNLATDLDTAQLLKSIKSIVPQLEAELKKTTGIDIKINDDAILRSINQITKEAETMASRFNKIQLSTDVTKLTTDYQKFGVVSKQVETNLKELKSAQQAVINAKGTDKLVSEIQKYDNALAKAKSSMKELTSTQVSLSQRTSQMTSMQEWMRKNADAVKLCGDRVNKLIAECENCNKVRFDQIKNEFKQIQVAAGEAGKLGNTLFGGFIEQGKKFVQWVGVTGVIMEAVQAGREMYRAVYDIDTAMTELGKVSDATNLRLQQSLEKSIATAQKYGSTIDEVVSATADWSRLGYNMDDAEKLAEIATIYKNVGDGIDISTANESLISTLQGFGKTSNDAMHIIDSFNEVANNFAIDSNGIGQALQRSASSMAAAGNTMEETIGLITAANGVVQDPESVGKVMPT